MLVAPTGGDCAAGAAEPDAAAVLVGADTAGEGAAVGIAPPHAARMLPAAIPETSAIPRRTIRRRLMREEISAESAMPRSPSSSITRGCTETMAWKAHAPYAFSATVSAPVVFLTFKD